MIGRELKKKRLKNTNLAAIIFQNKKLNESVRKKTGKFLMM